MLVYTFYQRFGVPVEELDRIARDWLAQKLKRTRPLQEGDGAWSARGLGGMNVEYAGRLGSWTAYRLTHPDSEISGRLWKMHIGVRGLEEGGAEASVVTEISDVSPLHVTQPQLRRPMLVTEWLRHAEPEMLPPAPQTLHTGADLQQLIAAAQDLNRLHPLILVSRFVNGLTPIDLGDLRDRLAGQAQWIEVSPSFDTRAEEYAQQRWAVWRGGISIILPPMRDRLNGGLYVPVERYSPDHLNQIWDSGADVATHLQGRFHHRTNLQIARVQIGPDQLQHARIQAEQQELLTRLSTGPTVMPEEVERIRATLDRTEAIARDAESAFFDAVMRADEAERLAEAAEQRARAAEHKAGAFSAQIDAIKAGKDMRVSVEPCVRDAFLRRMAGEDLTPEQALRLLAFMFPDRIVVLESAYRSAAEARGFTRPQKMVERLLRLTIDYVDAMRAGGGDAAGIKVFGADGYAAKESETVETRAIAVKLRTFTYKGVDYYMQRHLKIGTKRSAEDGWRCHFEWLPEEGRVVIGHCGKHLNFE